MALNPINGTSEADDLTGTNLADVIPAGAGDDTVRGIGGNDRIRGEAGNDLLFGGFGDDVLIGGGDRDVLIGEYGDDRLYGGAGDDHLWGGNYDESFYERMWGGDGNDFFYIPHQSSSEAHGDAGSDTAMLFWFGFDQQRHFTISITGPGAGAFGHHVNPLIGDFAVVLDSIECLIVTTGAGNDAVDGGELNDEINVQSGLNTVNAHGGNDLVIYLAGGANRLDGGLGEDTLIVGARGDYLTFTVDGATASDSFGAVIVGFEHYRVNGDWLSDTAYLGGGNDSFAGYRGEDLAYGFGGDDLLAGQSGNDSLHGGDGRDVLVGAAGADELTGGAGADRFRFTHSDAADTVIDMEQGIDKLQIHRRAIDYGLAAGTVDAANFSTGQASGHHGQFVLDYGFSGEASGLYWDADGEAADGLTLIAIFDGKPALTATDLLII